MKLKADGDLENETLNQIKQLINEIDFRHAFFDRNIDCYILYNIYKNVLVCQKDINYLAIVKCHMILSPTLLNSRKI